MQNKTAKIIPIIIICVLLISIAVTAFVLYSLSDKPQDPPHTDRDNDEISEETAEEPAESVNYRIEKDELSFENGDENLTLTQYFEKVVITDEGKAFEKINALIQAQSDKFIDEAKENDAFVADEGYNTQSNMYYINTHSAKVTVNAGGILSIKMVTHWFMGGVHNSNEYGLNFDLNTGEKLGIETILNMSRSDAEEYIKEESKKQIEDGFFEDAAETIDSYKLDDFDFYLSDDSICLCYSTHSLAPGAAGPVIMEIPIPEEE